MAEEDGEGDRIRGKCVALARVETFVELDAVEDCLILMLGMPRYPTEKPYLHIAPWRPKQPRVSSKTS